MTQPGDDRELLLRMETAAIQHSENHPKKTALALRDVGTAAPVEPNSDDEPRRAHVFRLPKDPNAMVLHLGTGFLRFESVASRQNYAASPGLRVTIGNPEL